MAPLLDPMLCDRGLPAGGLSGWPCEPKLDGWRALVLVDPEAELDVEGVVLKRLWSIYRPGERSRHWRKVKAPGWAAEHAERRQPDRERAPERGLL